MAKGRKSGPSRLDMRRQSEAAEAREGEEKVEEVEDDEAEDEDEEGEEEEADEEVAEEAADDDDGGDDDEEGGRKKKKAKAKPKAKPKKEPAKPKAKRARAVKVVTMKAVWVVFDNSNKRLNTFAYNAKGEAEEFLAKKQEEKKGTCYMQLVKEEMKEKVV